MFTTLVNRLDELLSAGVNPVLVDVLRSTLYNVKPGSTMTSPGDFGMARALDYNGMVGKRFGYLVLDAPPFRSGGVLIGTAVCDCGGKWQGRIGNISLKNKPS